MFFKIRGYFTVFVTISIWLLLLWNHYHGGVPSHHILAKENLPSVSNWWGGFWLPVLTWFLLSRIEKNFTNTKIKHPEKEFHLKHIIYRFAGALVFGITLSVFFTLGDTDVPAYLILLLLPLAFFVPVYRAECLLGFVMAMTFTFGAILPTGIGIILGIAGAVIYLVIRPGIRYVFSKLVSVLFSNK